MNDLLASFMSGTVNFVINDVLTVDILSKDVDTRFQRSFPFVFARYLRIYWSRIFYIVIFQLGESQDSEMSLNLKRMHHIACDHEFSGEGIFPTTVLAKTDRFPWYLPLNEGVAPQDPGWMKGAHFQLHASQRAQAQPCAVRSLGCSLTISLLVVTPAVW